VTPTTAKTGKQMWKLKFAVRNGRFEGRHLVDFLFFTDKALPRVKILCSALKVDASGLCDLTPEMLTNRSCRVTVYSKDYRDGTGTTQCRNHVTYDGFEAIESPENAKGDEASGDFNSPF